MKRILKKTAAGLCAAATLLGSALPAMPDSLRLFEPLTASALDLPVEGTDYEYDAATETLTWKTQYVFYLGDTMSSIKRSTKLVKHLKFDLNGANLIRWTTASNVAGLDQTDFSGLFKASGYDANYYLESVDFTSCGMSNVKNCKQMFQDCANLKSVKWNTSGYVSFTTNLQQMFYGCSNLEEVDISYMQTYSATTMQEMFSRCSSLKTIKWNTKIDQVYGRPKLTDDVTNMYRMFYQCSSLTSIPTQYFCTDNVMNMNEMFTQCHSLTSLDLSSFNTSKVIVMDRMFWYCDGLSELDLSSFNTPALTSLVGMFAHCDNLQRIYVGDGWTTANVDPNYTVDYQGDVFTDCPSLCGMRFTSYDEQNVDVSYAHIDGGETNPGYLSKKASTYYDNLTVGPYNLNDALADDIYGDGTVSYDPATVTLTLDGADLYADDASLLIVDDNDKNLPLTIYVASDSSITSGVTPVMLYSDTIITGPGKLAVSSLGNGSSGPENEAIYVNHAALTIDNANLDVYGSDGICADSHNDEYLVINNSRVHAAGVYDAISSFSGGITLNDSVVIDPRGAVPETVHFATGGSTLTFVDNSGTIVTDLTIEPIREYDLIIAGLPVRNDNCTDVLEDGVFSYDPEENVLTVNGSYTVPEDSGDPVIINWIPGLTIHVAADSTLTSSLSADAIASDADLFITGEGKLTAVSPQGSGISARSDLKIYDTEVSAHGFCGISGRGGQLTIDNAMVEATTSGAEDSFAIGSFDSIILNKCRIINPAEGFIDGGMVCLSDGSDAQSVLIGNPKALTDENVTLSKTQFTYTGSAIKVGSYITVKDGDKVLKYGTDYTTSYSKNTACGYETASITVKGIGRYAGSVTKYFTILPKKQAAPTLTVLNSEGGIHVEWTADTTCAGFQIDYCQNNSFTGDTLHTVYPYASKTSHDLAKFPKPGETWYLRIRAYIKDANGTKYGTWSPVSSIKIIGTVDNVTLSKTEFDYTGKAVKCGSYITVKAGTKTLKYGTDFTMSYANNVNAGVNTASVTITGIGNYTGTVTKNYSIIGKIDNVTLSKTEFAYTGKEVKCGSYITVKSGTKSLKYGTDFTMSYDNNVNPGVNTASVTITGIGNYSGSVTKNYTIVGKIETVTLSKTQFNYTGKEVKCGSYITVKCGGKSLKYGTDFTMSYDNNVNCGVGTASVTITGIGNYTGTVTKTYTIVPKKITPTVTAVSGGFKVTWTKDANAVGYEVSYCKDSSFTGDTLHSASYTGTSATLTKYPATGETWYVRVRAFITKDGTTSGTKYGTYSTAVTVKAG